MSWEPLASSDPVPGDPERVTAVADQLRQIAVSIEEQNGRLRGITADAFWEGDAADRFEADKEDLPPLLDVVRRRYGEVGSALARYAPELAAAQAQARRALAQARGAEADIASSERGIDRMEEYAAGERARVRAMATAYPDRPPPRPVPWSGPNYRALLGDAQADLAAARALLDQAIEQNQSAARTAADAISRAIDDDIRNTLRSRAEAVWDLAGDGWTALLHDLSEGARWLTEHLPIERLSHILGVIAAVAGTVALILTLTGVGAPVAAFLLGVAKAASLAKLALDVVLWAADDFSVERAITVLTSLVLLGASAGIGHLGHVARGAGQAASRSGDFARATRFADDVQYFARVKLFLQAGRTARGLIGLPDEIGGSVETMPTCSLVGTHPTVESADGSESSMRSRVAPISPFAPVSP